MTEIPAACTLPSAQVPPRIAQFTRLFSKSIAVDRPTPTRLTVTFHDSAPTAQAARELVAAETVCCSFFSFSLEPAAEGRLHLQIAVPSSHEQVLDEVAHLATSAAGRSFR